MSILGIDYGTRRVGVAVSDSLGFGVHPRPTLLITSVGDAVDQIVAVLTVQGDVEKIVVGLPLHTNGSENKQSQITREFTTALSKSSPIPIVLVDESLTSWASEQEMVDSLVEQTASRSRKKRRAVRRKEDVDQRAAMMILRDYLKSDAG